MRRLADLTFQDIPRRLGASSVLCLPMGSIEQHGPHLPLNTDLVLAEALTGRIVERFGERHDLWQLPALPIGLSREHDWAPGTLSLSVQGMTTLLRDLARELVRALPARNLLVVNGHGGNRGILEALGRELHGDFGLNICALHLGALMSPVGDGGLPEIHAGRDETSAMLALAPELVRRERLAELKSPPDADAVRALILDPGADFPWRTDDPRLADTGVIGDAAAATAEHGHALVERVLAAAGVAIARLVENGKAIRP
jgi:creatinine amidohydrolase/Fe(II)-dependent formamide hydrolase-like protein